MSLYDVVVRGCATTPATATVKVVFGCISPAVFAVLHLGPEENFPRNGQILNWYGQLLHLRLSLAEGRQFLLFLELEEIIIQC